MQEKSRQSNGNKAESSQSKNGVYMQKGYSQVFVVFWLERTKI